MLIFALIVILIITLLAVCLLSYRYFDMKFEKKNYHKYISKKLLKIAKDNDFYLLNKISLDIDAKVQIHFNHILFSNRYIYCIVDAYFEGYISGKKEDLSWFEFSRDGKNVIHIKNPCNFQRTRIQYFSAFIGSSSDMIIPILVVNNGCLIDEKTLGEETMLVHRKDLKRKILELEKNSTDVPYINPFELEKVVTIVYQKGVK